MKLKLVEPPEIKQLKTVMEIYDTEQLLDIIQEYFIGLIDSDGDRNCFVHDRPVNNSPRLIQYYVDSATGNEKVLERRRTYTVTISELKQGLEECLEHGRAIHIFTTQKQMLDWVFK